MKSACLSGPNQECTNAGSLPSNACPGGDPSLQCTAEHSCVFQVQQSTPTPTCPADGTVIEDKTYLGCQSSCSGDGKCFN